MAAAALSPAELRLSLTPWQVLICIRLHNVPAPSGSQFALTFCAPCRPQTAAQSTAISLSAPCWSLNESANSALIPPTSTLLFYALCYLDFDVFQHLS